jgi:putative transposase
MVELSQRREIAIWAVKTKGRSIRRACELFGVSQACYRCEPKRSGENDRIADWLSRLAHNHRNLVRAFLFLRNVGLRGDHKRVYRIYRLLELKLRIKSKRRLVREVPQPLAVPDGHQ